MTKNEERNIDSIVDIEMRARALCTQEAGKIINAMFRGMGRFIADIYDAVINRPNDSCACSTWNEKFKIGEEKSTKTTDRFV